MACTDRTQQPEAVVRSFKCDDESLADLVERGGQRRQGPPFAFGNTFFVPLFPS